MPDTMTKSSTPLFGKCKAFSEMTRKRKEMHGLRYVSINFLNCHNYGAEIDNVYTPGHTSVAIIDALW